MKVASMGPRLFGRGRVTLAADTRHTRPTLQWGRVCLDAEGADFKIQRCHGSRVASMGPRLFGRGRAPPNKGVIYRKLAASMGPRLFGRGRGLTTAQSTTFGVASMGPRLFGRGRSSGAV